MLNDETKEKLLELQEKNTNNGFYGEEKYSICDFVFIESTHRIKITFLKSEQYRTIVRYVQRNYERYPIYSEWKTKTTKISKSLKIDCEVLEQLKNNPEYLIRKFAYAIIAKLDKNEFVPSWAKIDIINNDENKETKPYLDEMSCVYETYSKNKNSILERIELNNKKIALFQNKLIRPNKKAEKIKLKISNTQKEKTILRLNKKLEKIKWKIKVLQKVVDIYACENNELNEKIKSLEKTHNKKVYQLKKEILNIQNKFNEQKSKVKKLNIDVFNLSNQKDFISISNLSLMKYEKITGVYVIKNNEKNKYYVGQSKDVLRRLKQHFKNGVPANIIFAQDYYSSENKDNLFSVKIIPLSLKDELDRTEKQLIEEYDSFKNGYNKTSGNT